MVQPHSGSRNLLFESSREGPFIVCHSVLLEEFLIFLALVEGKRKKTLPLLLTHPFVSPLVIC